MRVVWMRTNSEEQTEFVDLEFATSPHPRGVETAVVATQGTIFRTGQPAVEMGFHNAPRRQFVIPITGDVTVASGNGTSRHIGPGDALLADDLTGQGHTSVFGPDGAAMMFLLLDDSFDPLAYT